MTKTSGRTLILVTDFYPPDPTGRAGKMERHIQAWRERGHDAVVIVPERAGGTSGLMGAHDSHVRIVRVPIPLARLSDALRPAPAHHGRARAFTRIFRSYLRWDAAAFRAVRSIVQDTPGPVVMTVSNPVSLHLVGLATHFTTRAPWIAELRDPWSDNPAAPRSWEGMHRAVAGAVLRHADLVISYRSVQGHRGDLVRRYPFLTAHSLELPWFGFDPPDQVTPRANPPRLLVYTGQWYPPKTVPEMLLEPFARLAAIDRDLLGGVRLLIVGPWPDDAARLTTRLGLDDVVQAIGSLSPAATVEWQRKADGGVIIVPEEDDDRRVTLSKFWDYLSAGLPIVAVAPRRSLVADLVRRYRLGAVVTAEEPGAAAQQLAQILRSGYPSVRSRPNPLFTRLASRHAIEERLFDRVEKVQDLSASRG